MTPRYPQALWTIGLLVLLPGVARADTLVAPAGGAGISLGAGRVLCKDGSDLRGWTPEGDNARIKPPSTAPADYVAAQLHVANSTSQCANSNTILRAVAADDWPVVDPGSVTLNVDAGRLDVRGKNLRGAVLRWSSNGRVGSDACRDLQTANGTESCALTLDRDLPADPTATVLTFYPPGVPGDGEVFAFDAQGRSVRADAVRLVPARLVLLSLLPMDAAVDTSSDVSHLPLRHADAVGSVECQDAICELQDGEISVRGERGNDEVLEMRLHLRPHVYLQGVANLDANPAMDLPLQRCPVGIASAAPLRGVSGQNVVVRVSGRCGKDSSLRFLAGGVPARVVTTLQDGDNLFAVVHADRMAGEEFSITVQRGGQVVGIARGHTRVAPSIHARIELPGRGPIDFIPTNRDASVVLPTMGEGAVWVPLAVEGVYSVSRDATGADKIRGMEGTAGWVALRLAYRDKNLPGSLRDVNLAEVADAVDRSVKPANLPVALAAANKDPLVELVCNNEQDGPTRVKPGAPTNIPYGQRDSCHLVLHRELLLPEDGEQTLRIVGTLSSADGAPRPEAALDMTVRLRPSTTPRLIYMGGAQAPFDKLVLRASLLADDAHYAVISDEGQGAPPLQWSVTMGTSLFRFYTTISFPTGLYRLADKGHSGILGLNGGILFRFVVLNSEGMPNPFGLEAGVMWMGIANDTASATYGQVGLLAGLGISVPVANLARATQASISLHIWAEYEVSRAVAGRDNGNPWGFVFGPSFSVGNVGMNL